MARGRVPIDISGQRFGDWLVLAHAGGVMWRCRCRCGVEAEVASAKLRSGKSTSCKRCAAIRRREAGRVVPVGERFGRSIVIALARRGGPAGDEWLMLCDCGVEFKAQAHAVKARESTQCRKCGLRAAFAARRVDAEVEAMYGDFDEGA